MHLHETGAYCGGSTTGRRAYYYYYYYANLKTRLMPAMHEGDS